MSRGSTIPDPAGGAHPALIAALVEKFLESQAWYLFVHILGVSVRIQPKMLWRVPQPASRGLGVWSGCCSQG
jgi:hypothetical protein